MQGKINNISSVVSANLCLGCGICEDVCSKQKAIRIMRTKTFYVPKIDVDLCTDCGLCLKVCPGKSVELNSISKELFHSKDIKEDKYLDRYHKCYAGYSNKEEIRYHCASGGLVSQFLIYLLEKKVIDGAVVVGFKLNNVTEPNVYIAETAEDILNGKSSKYCPVSYQSIIPEINKRNGKYVIVGLPCHIHGFRKYERINKSFKNKISGYFAIYCSGTKNFLYQEYLFYRYGIDKKQLKKFAYRDDGCLGYMKCEYYDGTIKKISYLDYYSSMKNAFTPVRCTLCIDHYGELADVCFGDLHIGKYIKDKVGVNSLVVRSAYFDKLLKQAKAEGIISLDCISEQTVNDSQESIYSHKKGPGIVAAFKLRHFLNKETPAFDVSFNSPLKIKSLIIEIQKLIFRKIGSIPCLWFIIKWTDIILPKKRNE